MTFSEYDEIVLHTCGKNAARQPSVLAELKRIGIDNPIVQINNESGRANVRETLLRAHERGYRRVLCIEDDVRFLKNVADVELLFKSAPEDEHDICSFDNFLHLRVDLLAQLRSGGAKWCRWMPMVYGSSCWSFGAKAARVLLESYDAHPNEPSDSDKFMMHQDLASCFLTIPACIQICYSDCVNVKKGWALQHHAGYTFINYNDYNIPEGYRFGAVIKP